MADWGVVRLAAGPKSVAWAMGAASLRRSAIANASQLPHSKVVKRYCPSLSGAISSTVPFCLLSIKIDNLNGNLKDVRRNGTPTA